MLLADQGFDIVRCLSADDIPNISTNMILWLEAGFHGDLGWMSNNANKRIDPRYLMPEVKSLFLVGLNYAPEFNPLEEWNNYNHGLISAYAKGEDYHDIMKKRLRQAAQILSDKYDFGVRIFVDTAPFHEKSLAQKSGIGWQGKHTNVVSRTYGSWLFLGALICDEYFDSDSSEVDHCGKCRKCLDACPTNAFVKPYLMDARRCISYLTIEYKGIFPRKLAKQMGNYIYGCDICLTVCPWNKFAKVTSESSFALRDITDNPSLSCLLDYTEQDFRQNFRKTPIKRIGYIRFMRNVLNAVGNSKNHEFLEKISKFIGHENEILAVTAQRAYSDIKS